MLEPLLMCTLRVSFCQIVHNNSNNNNRELTECFQKLKGQNWFGGRIIFPNWYKPPGLAITGLDRKRLWGMAYTPTWFSLQPNLLLWTKKLVPLQKPIQTHLVDRTHSCTYLALSSALSLSTGLSAERIFCKVARASCHAARPSPMKALRVGCNKGIRKSDQYS